jgi:hypothetical protein
LINENLIVLAVAGRITEEHIETLRGVMEQEMVPPVLDQNVIFVGREAVKFLANIEAKGCELRNCPLYVREWITRERRGTTRQAPTKVPKSREKIENA